MREGVKEDKEGIHEGGEAGAWGKHGVREGGREGREGRNEEGEAGRGRAWREGGSE